MIDKTAREARAIIDARLQFANELNRLGLMSAFHSRNAADIDSLIEACVDGYFKSMRRQENTPERYVPPAGPLTDDDIPF